MKLEFYFVADLEKGHRVRSHTHRALEIVYFLKGFGRTKVGQTTYDIRRNLFTVIPAGIYHDQENSTKVVSFCMGLVGSGLEPFQGGWNDTGGLIHVSIQKLLTEMKGGKPFYEDICLGILQEIVGLVKRASRDSAKPTGKEQIVSQAIALIREQEGIVSIDDLADQLYVSKDYLRHLFLEYTNQSPIRHIINTRIENARQLLVRPELTIDQVARKCGFRNLYYFSRLFKRETGHSPSEFRRSITEKDK